jgi:hypothetical protein
VSEAGYLLGTDRYSAAVAWLLHGRSGVLTALASAPAPQPGTPSLPAEATPQP